MKKILFCLQTMVLGGVEKELVTIMKQMSPKDYDITLLLFYSSDSYIMQQIPAYVRVIDLELDKKYYFSDCVSMCKQRVMRKKYFEAGMLALRRVLKIGMTHSNIDMSDVPSCNDIYDIAICYHLHSPFALRYVAEKTKAYKKIAWIHNDFLTTRYPIARLQRYLNVYQEVIAVSHTVERVQSVLP